MENDAVSISFRFHESKILQSIRLNSFDIHISLLSCKSLNLTLNFIDEIDYREPSLSEDGILCTRRRKLRRESS